MSLHSLYYYSILEKDCCYINFCLFLETLCYRLLKEDILLSLFCVSLFLFVVVIINLLSCMIIEIMHSWTEEALHYRWTSVSFMLTCLEAHITRIMFLTLLSFVTRGILSNFTETRVVSFCLAENAVS